MPQVEDPSRALDYDNLVYACSTCNLFKSDVENVPDPCQVAFGDLVEVADDGRIEAKNNSFAGRFLIAVLRLDNAENTKYRRRQPPEGNSRPNAIQQSFLAKRQEGELPRTY